MLFDALAEAFRVLGVVPRRGTFDNIRTAVDRERPRRSAYTAAHSGNKPDLHRAIMELNALGTEADLPIAPNANQEIPTDAAQLDQQWCATRLS